MNALWQRLKAQQGDGDGHAAARGREQRRVLLRSGGGPRQGNDTSRRQMLLVVIVVHSEQTRSGSEWDVREAAGIMSLRARSGGGGGGGGPGTPLNKYSVAELVARQDGTSTAPPFTDLAILPSPIARRNSGFGITTVKQ
jgi:hypothetical protein